MTLYLFYEEETEAPEGKGLAQGLTAIKGKAGTWPFPEPSADCLADPSSPTLQSQEEITR